MGTCQPPIQNFGAPNGLFCVGNWQCYPDCNDWYWMGQRRTVNGGWVGNPFSGYTLVPKPTAPCGGQSAPPPPPPAPPPPASGRPVETTPPKPPHDTAPPGEHDQCGSGASMASMLEMERDFGFNSDEQAGWPGVGKFVGVNKYAGLQTVQGDTIQKQTRPTVSVPAYIEKDADGNIRVLHPATGPGEIWLAPPEIEDYHLAGEHASHTGKLAGVALPKTISRVGLNIASFKRANSSHGDDVDGYLGWGVYHPAGTYVADGWIAKLTGAVGARHLEFFSTDVEGALDSDPLKLVKVNGTALTGVSGNEVTAAAVLTDGKLVMSDGGARGAKVSGVTAGGASLNDLSNIGTIGSGAITSSGFIKSTSSSAGIGYSTGAGGTVTQLTSKTTAVTLDKICGDITMHNAALAAGATAKFTVNNSVLDGTEYVMAQHTSGGASGAYAVEAYSSSAGGLFQINVTNITTGSLSEAIVIRFIALKGATA